MPECVVCGEDDYMEERGLFYCTTCNTQSQNMQVIMCEDDDNPATFTGFSNVIREKKTDGAASRKKVVDKGRPWSIYEAYQILLQHQVEALIKLGAHPQLKDVVFRIWVKYLSKLGVAFSDKSVPESSAYLNRQREMFPPTTKNPKVRNVLGRRSLRQTLGVSAKKSKQQTDSDELQKAVDGEEFYEEDNPFNKEQKESGSESSSEEEEEEQESKKPGTKRKNLHSCSVYKMQMNYTLAFCYLGLMYTNPATMVTDLLRWVRQNKVPFKAAADVIPKDMKFCLNDWKLFMGIAPSPQKLRQLTGSLAYFLSLSDFPEVPLQQLISKYILQLDLPASMHAYAINIWELLELPVEYKPSKSLKKVPFWEGLAMGCIIISLRSIFGLNGQTERLFSVFSREVMRLIDNRHRLFVYDDWVVHMRTRLYIQQLREAEQDTTDNKLKESSACMLEAKKNRLFQKRVRSGLLRPFLSLEEQLGTRQQAALGKEQNTEDRLQNSVENQSDSIPGNQIDSTAGNHCGSAEDTNSVNAYLDFNLENNTLMEEDPIGYLLGHHDDVEMNEADQSDGKPESGGVKRLTFYLNDKLAKLNQEGDKFRKSSFQHLIFPQTYLETLDRHGLMEATIDSSCASLSDFASQDGTDPVQTDHTGHEQTSHNKTSAEDKVRSSLRRYIEANLQSGPTISKIVNMERYSYVIEQLYQVRENFLLALDEDSSNDCMAYGLLLDVCAHVIDCDRSMLQDEVRKAEMKLLAECGDVKKGHRMNFNLLKLKNNSHQYAAKRVTKF